MAYLAGKIVEAPFEGAQETGTDLVLTWTARTYFRRNKVRVAVNTPRKAVLPALADGNDKNAPPWKVLLNFLLKILMHDVLSLNLPLNSGWGAFPSVIPPPLETDFC